VERGLAILRLLRPRLTDKGRLSPEAATESRPRPGDPNSAGPRRTRIWQSQARSVDIGPLQDALLVSAVVTILAVRSQLWLTNYPKLGGGNLHIAHLLWGGALMLIALGLLLSFVGRSLRTPAAILGGIGFGLFIDEVGKFITANNDYFFKPAAAIIYVIFVVLFLLGRAMQQRRGLEPREYLINALDLLTEAARRNLDDRERGRALELLRRADPDAPLVGPVLKLLEETETVRVRSPGLLARVRVRMRVTYDRFVERPGFRRALSWFFIAWALLSFITVILIGIAAALKFFGVPGVVLTFGDRLSLLEAASFVSSVVASALVIYGVWRLRRGPRLDAYRMFERALLVQIFIGQFFSFLESQFAAAFGLAFDILLLVTVRHLIAFERERLRAEGPSSSLEGGSYAQARSEIPATGSPVVPAA
jgi:hypothetical protein